MKKKELFENKRWGEECEGGEKNCLKSLSLLFVVDVVVGVVESHGE